MADYFDQFPNVLLTLHQWTILPKHNILFDSRYDNWTKYNSEFFINIKDKQNLFIIIHDMDANIFGGYLSQPITKQNEWITDDQCYLFSISSNGRIEQPTKFPIKQEKKNNAFIVFGDDFEYLFQFGYGYDIIACKQDHAQNFNSGVNETSFDFNKIKNPLTCSKTFIINRLVVVEMHDKVEKLEEVVEKQNEEEIKTEETKEEKVEINEIVEEVNEIKDEKKEEVENKQEEEINEKKDEEEKKEDNDNNDKQQEEKKEEIKENKPIENEESENTEEEQ